MAFVTPRLDDRAFQDLVDEARARIPLYCPEWTDHNLSDPGITLVELFAWMTDITLYRLNRMPDKHYIKFMELIGMRLYGAEPARAPMTFWLSSPQPANFLLPGGTETATTRTETEQAIVFTTDGDATIYVPTLQYIMTSSSTAAEARAFAVHNLSNAQEGTARIPVFPSAPPTQGDALYLGFDEDLTHHIIAVEIDVETAEGAGVDPNNPPYVWEVLGQQANQNWVPVEVEQDTTRALNVNGTVRLFIPPMRRAPRNDVTAFWLRCRLIVEEGQPNYGVSPTVRRLQVSSWGITVDTTNISRVQHETIGRSDGSPGQIFYLNYTPVVARTGGEYVMIRTEDGREERWFEVGDFSASGADDRHYTLDSQTGELRFGPALRQRDGGVRRYGAIPPQNAAIIITGYRYGGGVVGNVAAGTINVLKSAVPYIQRVANRQPATGGLNAEDIEACKMRVPAYLRSLNRAVTVRDFEYLAREAAPGQVGRVHCLQPPLTNRGDIKLLVIPAIPRLEGFIAPESLNLSEDLQRRVYDYLEERRLLSTRLEVLAPAYQWVETEVRFRAGRHDDVEKVRQLIERRLFQFINPLVGGQEGTGWPFGRDLFVADIMSVLLTLPGVDFVRSVHLYPVAYDGGEFVRGAEVQEIPVVSHGVVVSYRHTARQD
ncbi:MAG: putative baseplate assembly protein [Anaerolineae bacterium]|nr:putative baseplate assembly protein [Anaerolineae bacterium]